MNLERVGTAALCALLVAVGGSAWWLQLRSGLEVDTAPLAALPRTIDRWRAQDLPVESTVEAILRADYNLQRAYTTREGSLVWLYVGYYGTERGGRPEHTPRGCYTGAGWDIASMQTLAVPGVAGFQVNEYVVERESEQRLVHFWFRSHRRTGMLGGMDQNVDRVLGRLLEGRADGALVRLSTPLDAEAGDARGRLLGFAAKLDPLLEAHWPREFSASS